MWKRILKEKPPYEPKWGEPLKERITQVCDKCGRYIRMPVGAIYGEETSKYCGYCKRQREEDLQALRNAGYGE